MTAPGLIVSALRGYRDRVKIAERLALAGAWYTTALDRQKMLPELAEFLGEPPSETHKESVEQSPVTMAHNARLWRAVFARAA